MRRGRIFIYLALIIILGLVAAYVLYQRYGQPAEIIEEPISTPQPVIELIDVVVISQNTPRGTILDDTLVALVEIPKNDAVDGMFFNNINEVVGRRAKFDLDSGIPLTASMLVDQVEQLSTTGSLAALNIPKGMVAVSIPISRLSSISYAPRPGDHVSVIVTMLFVDLDSEYQTKLPNELSQLNGPVNLEGINELTVKDNGNAYDKSDSAFVYQGRIELDPLLNELMYVVPTETQRPRMVSQTLLPNATILNVGDFPYEDEEPVTVAEDQVEVPTVPQQGTEVAATPSKPPDVITLIVTPQEAVTLNYILFSNAKFTLALRASGDDDIVATSPATLQFLLNQYDITLPEKLPYGIEPRINTPVLPALPNDQGGTTE
jgi:Flp pilus assembly protein CpaB